MTSATYSVTGMHCGGCAKAVERAARELSGVSRAQVDLPSGKLSVDFDPKALTVDALAAAVEEAGYGFVRS